GPAGQRAQEHPPRDRHSSFDDRGGRGCRRRTAFRRLLPHDEEVMLHLIDGLKRQLHRDIAADPRTHGWVLNLYLNGERYPQTVCDYFQSEYAPTKDLADLIALHEKDEHKHELIFGKAIRSLGEEVVEL